MHLLLLDMSALFQVVIVAGFHLFPFRTEKLSPPAPMVLHTRGRVGSRRFLVGSPSRGISRGFLFMGRMGRMGQMGFMRVREPCADA